MVARDKGWGVVGKNCLMDVGLPFGVIEVFWNLAVMTLHNMEKAPTAFIHSQFYDMCIAPEFEIIIFKGLSSFYIFAVTSVQLCTSPFHLRIKLNGNF